MSARTTKRLAIHGCLRMMHSPGARFVVRCGCMQVSAHLCPVLRSFEFRQRTHPIVAFISGLLARANRTMDSQEVPGFGGTSSLRWPCGKSAVYARNRYPGSEVQGR